MFLFILSCFSALISSAWADWRDEIGYTDLRAQLGADTPSGAGVDVVQVEGNYLQTHRFLPSTDDPEFTDKAITDRTGLGLTSTHATQVARYCYGLTTSIAPGIDVIDCYQADHWLEDGFLRTFGLNPPRIESRRIQNHSWISRYFNWQKNTDAIERLDLVIDRDGVVACASVNNYDPADPTSREMPVLMCSAYNGIAVGLTNGKSSYGPTITYVSGRSKPDLVATAGTPLTSYATAVTSASAAMLVEAQERLGVFSDLPARERLRATPMLTKCLLMGGATKPEGWRPGTVTPRTDGTIPLDYRYGAGSLNIHKSYRILSAGQHAGGNAVVVPCTGWDYGRIAAAERRYFLEIPQNQVASTISIMLVWHRRIATPPDLDRDDDVDSADLEIFRACTTGANAGPYPAECREVDFDDDADIDQSDFGVFQVCVSGADQPPPVACRRRPTASLANLDLKLYATEGFELGALRAQSISPIDNVEHIYLQNVSSGSWAIVVSSDGLSSYALTWDAQLTVSP
ncbi:MAG: hypothetical protein AMXMBFR13_00530 [Phycisphaerae bacterium]